MATPREFYKMTGSGNDFVVFDGMTAAPELDPATIGRLCARGTGVGADGVVVLERSATAAFVMKYFNSDASPAFCGNASLCSTRLAVDLGRADPAGFSFETSAGEVSARIREGLPEVDLQPVSVVRADAAVAPEGEEQRIGYALVGVPHLVVLCADIERVAVGARGRELRRHPSLPTGANVNFVSRTPAAPAGWAMRTFERGVEAETLACGSGAVATAILLSTWGLSSDSTTLRTRSGATLRVTLARSGGSWAPSLAGEGRLVFRGTLETV